MARIQAQPEPLDLDLYHEDDFALTFTFNNIVYPEKGDPQKSPIDISGWIFTAFWRPNRKDTRQVPWEFGDRDDKAGMIVLEVPSSTFESMRAISPSGVWDIQVTFPDGTKQTMLSGYVYTDMDVSP